MRATIRFTAFCLATVLAIASLVALSANGQQAPKLPNISPAQIDQRADALVKQMTLEEKIDLLGGSGIFKTTPLARLNIPAFLMSDGPVGAHIPPPSTAYAAGIGLAASWDPQLAERIGRQLGRDARSRGANYLLGPGVNIYRAPMNGRNFEYFGEDPFLGSRIVIGYIDGVQAEGVSATVKHYLGNNSEFARFTSDSIIDERTMREIYMPIFEAAVKEAHVGSIMDSYNFTNGQHLTESGYLNTTVAKEQWGFDGLIMSDWTATHDGIKAVNGGLDLEMPFPQFMNRETLLPAVKSGEVKESVIDDHVRRLLRVAIRFGWLDHPQLDLNVSRFNPQGDEAAFQGASEGAVLLKNEGGLLPLDRKRIHNIAVIGPNAFPGSPTAGGSGEVPTFNSVGALRGISDALGSGAIVTYARGIPTLHQIAAGTVFTTDPRGNHPGVAVDSFPTPEMNGKPESSSVERGITYGKPGLGDPEDVEALGTLTAADFGRLLTNPKVSYKRWTGYYTPKSAGAHTLFMQTTENYRILVDDKVIIDYAALPKALLTNVQLDLTAAPHKVVLEELGGTAFGEGFARLGIAANATIVDSYAKALAKNADVVVIAAGFNAEIESEGSDREFTLPIGQDELIREIAQVNPKTIVVLTSGGAVDVTPWLASVPAVLEAWYPGQEGGKALAGILLGDIDPSGHLPITWDASLAQNPSAPYYYYTQPGTNKVEYKEGIFTGYRGYDHAGTKPEFPFGFGLSYTTFQYGHLNIVAGNTPGDYKVSYDVTNTGSRSGADISQVYVGEQHPKVSRPIQELKGFARTQLKPGETRHLEVELNARAFTYYDVQGKHWQADSGTYTVRVGSSSASTPLSAIIKLDKPISLPN
jgi:beta-glucosidase